MATFTKLPSIAHGPAKRLYDVIVFGGQMAGALSAAMLAKRGYRVMLVEHDGMGPGYEHAGYLLPYGPFVAPPLRALPAVEEAMTELGITSTILRTVKTHVPELQLILPKNRLDLHKDEPKRVAELTREFGAAGYEVNDTLKALMAYRENSDFFFRQPLTLPADGFFETRSMKSLMKRHPGLEAALPEGGHPASQLLLGLLPFVSYLQAPSFPVAQGRPLSQALAQPGRYPGGREGLRELFIKRFVDLGGQVLNRDSLEGFVVEHLSFDGDKLVGLKVLGSENVYRCSVVVASTDAGALRRLIEDKKGQRKLIELLDLSATKRFLFAANWVLKAEVIPRGMGELLAMDTGDDLSPLLIQVQSARRVGKADDETHRVVCAGTFVPSTTRELGEAHLANIAERIGNHLDALMPFAKGSLALASAPYLDAGGVRGSRLLPHPLFSMETEKLVGVEGLPQRTPVKNLILANREVLPGLGLEGEFLAALQAANLVQESLKKRDPLKR